MRGKKTVRLCRLQHVCDRPHRLTAVPANQALAVASCPSLHIVRIILAPIVNGQCYVVEATTFVRYKIYELARSIHSLPLFISILSISV